MNRFKTTPNSTSNKQQSQKPTSNTSLSQNSPKSAEKLEKPTVSTFINNNAPVDDMVRKSSTGSTGGGRPSSGNSPKAKSPQTNSGQQQQQKRSTTPVQNNKNASVTSPTTTGPRASSPQGTTTGPSNSQQQQKQSNNVAPNQNSAPQKQNQQFSSQKGAVGSTSSTSSIKSNGNGNNKPKTAVGNNQQFKPTSQTVSNHTNNHTNNNGPNRPGPMNSVMFQRTPTKTFPIPISQQRYPSNISRSMVSLERSRNFRAFIEKAMNDHKIFSCCGVYPAIRNALKKRGWVEKPGPLAYSRSANASLSLSPNTRGPEDESDVAWMTRVMKDYPPDFIWVIRRDNIDWKSLTREQMINRFPKAWFTTKVGLAACLQHMHWFSEAGVSDTFFPRCYRLCLEEERQAFQDDYRLTACMSYLRYFVDTFEMKGHAALADVHSKITPLSVDFASRQLGNYIRMRRHEDIDWLLPPNFMTQHWDAFIHQYYAVVHEKKRLRFDSPEAVHVKYETAKKMLHKIAQYWPQIELDGRYNMWICKPGARSRGKGIVIMNTLEKIMDLMSQSNFRECNWVVQKYIEKPMLIYKTKFDIRQWFLITDWTPLTVWFYKESYVRFCTKPFLLEDFHESIHLCNNAIQCRYTNSDQRDSNLPDENMWSSDTFQAYLKTVGRLDAWPLIYSGMKQAIVGVLLASQETVESKRGCYELYGADFMLTEDFRPWLIEINSCPCMAASTSVTARMCAQCLEDTVKVVVDRKNNRNADTGMFEMIYRQNAGSVAVQQFSGHDLTIIGKKLTRDIDWPMTMSKSITSVHPRKISHQSMSNQSHSSNNNRQTLSELLQKLRVRNQEMFQGALATQQTKMDKIFEGASGNADAAGSLLNKMRSLKSANNNSINEQDITSGMKKVYPSQDPKQQTSGGKQATTEVEKEASATGKGEDPSSISSKLTDMNSLAYLMRNTHVGKDAVPHDSKSKRPEEKKTSHVTQPEDNSTKATPTPKTLAEVKALVEATKNSEKYGKILFDINSKNMSKLASESDDNDNTTTQFDFNLDSGEKQADTSDNCGNEGCDTVAVGATKSIKEDSDVTKNATPALDSAPLPPAPDSASLPPAPDSASLPPAPDSASLPPASDSATLPSAPDSAPLPSAPDSASLPSAPDSASLPSAPDLPPPPPEKLKDEKFDEHIENIFYSETIRRSKSLQFSSHHSLGSWASSEDCRHLKQLSSKHSFTNKRVDSQAYMIYPLPAHPSYDHLPCKEKENPIIQADLSKVESHKNIIVENPTNNNNMSELTVEADKVDSIPVVEGCNQESATTAPEEVDADLIDLITSDTTVKEQLKKARSEKSNEKNEEPEDPQGKLYQSILFPTSSISSSESDDDNECNDDNNNEINISTNFIPSTFGFRPKPINSPMEAAVTNDQNKNGENPAKPKTHKYYKRRSSTPSNRRCSRRFPCYRVMLESQSCQVKPKRKSAATLPMKTVNLLLPSNCNNYC